VVAQRRVLDRAEVDGGERAVQRQERRLHRLVPQSQVLPPPPLDVHRLCGGHPLTQRRVLLQQLPEDRLRGWAGRLRRRPDGPQSFVEEPADDRDVQALEETPVAGERVVEPRHQRRREDRGAEPAQGPWHVAGVQQPRPRPWGLPLLRRLRDGWNPGKELDGLVAGDPHGLASWAEVSNVVTRTSGMTEDYASPPVGPHGRVRGVDALRPGWS